VTGLFVFNQDFSIGKIFRLFYPQTIHGEARKNRPEN